MSRYVLGDLVLAASPSSLVAKVGLHRLLTNLSWAESDRDKAVATLVLELREGTREVPGGAALLFNASEFSVYSDEQVCYVTDGRSSFHLMVDCLRGEAYLHPSFFEKVPETQWSFWSYGLLKLLRQLGFYSLHAAAIVSPAGWGMLLCGPSGSGKSTLSMGLVREGWGYLSDDAVLLNTPRGTMTVTALRLRRHFFVDAPAAERYSDVPMGGELDDRAGRRRRRLHLEERYPEQCRLSCRPRKLVFPRIVKSARSELRAVSSVTALGFLLAASASQLFDRRSMDRQIQTLKALLKQTEVYELDAGRDLYEAPAKLLSLLQEV